VGQDGRSCLKNHLSARIVPPLGRQFCLGGLDVIRPGREATRGLKSVTRLSSGFGIGLGPETGASCSFGTRRQWPPGHPTHYDFSPAKSFETVSKNLPQRCDHLCPQRRLYADLFLFLVLAVYFGLWFWLFGLLRGRGFHSHGFHRCWLHCRRLG
jgi:hypothetical protein